MLFRAPTLPVDHFHYFPNSKDSLPRVLWKRAGDDSASNPTEEGILVQNGPPGMSDREHWRGFEWISPGVNTSDMWTWCLRSHLHEGREVYGIVAYHTES